MRELHHPTVDHKLLQYYCLVGYFWYLKIYESMNISLREKCPYSELFWSVFFRIRTEYGEIFRISPLRIRSECGKIQTRITPNMDTFYAVYESINLCLISRGLFQIVCQFD